MRVLHRARVESVANIEVYVYIYIYIHIYVYYTYTGVLYKA